MSDNKNAYNIENFDEVKVACLPKPFIKKKLNSLIATAEEEKNRIVISSTTNAVERVMDMDAGKVKSVTLDKDEFNLIKEYIMAVTTQSISELIFDWVNREEGMMMTLNIPDNTNLDSLLNMFGYTKDDVNIHEVDNKNKDNNNN